MEICVVCCVFTSWFGVFYQISLGILDRFSQSFHRMKALYVQMMDLYLIFQFVKRRLPWQPNNIAVMKAN